MRLHWIAIAIVAIAIIVVILFNVFQYFGISKTETLRIAIPTDISTIDIHFAKGVSDFEILGKVYESLFKIYFDSHSNKLMYKPWLIRSFTRINNTYWVFILRSNVHFHNGKELTSDDVKCSLERAMKIGPIGRMLLRDAEGKPIIKEIRVLNMTAFALILNKPFYPLIENLAHLATAIMPREICEKYFDTPVTNLSDVIGTGPYKLIEYRRGKGAKLALFTNYWETKPRVKNVEYIVSPDPNARVSALLTGQVDIILGVPPELIQQLKEKNFKIYNITGARLVLVAINVKRIPEVRVRQAMNYAIDKRSIVENMLYGYARVADSVVSPVFPGAAKLRIYKYNSSKAQQLLRESGEINETLKLLVSTRSPTDIEVAQIIQNLLKRIGIEVVIEELEHTAFLKRVFVEHDFDLALYGPSPSSLYYALTYWRTGAALNAPQYSNPYVDKLLDKAASEKDPAKRAEIYRIIQEVIWKDCPAIWLYFENVVIASKPTVNELKILPFQMLDLEKVSIDE